MSDYLGPYLLGPNDENQGIYTGDARELAKAIPDESVDLIFTDPVYDQIDDYRWLAEMGARVLKPGGQLVFHQAHVYYSQTFAAVGENLKFRWLGTERKVGTQSTIWGPRVLGRTRHLFFYYRPPRIFRKWLIDCFDKQPAGRGNHRWSKHSGTLHWIKQLDDNLILCLDPFVGGGEVASCCKMLGRRWLAFEIDPDIAEMARERVRNTQPPLPGLNLPEQMKLGIDDA